MFYVCLNICVKLCQKVTYNTLPSVSRVQLGTWNKVSAGFMYFSSTSFVDLVTDWVSGTQDSYGVYIVETSTISGDTLASRQNNIIGHRPTLVIDYYCNPTPTFAPTLSPT